MEIKEMKELIELLKDTDYNYIEIKHEENKIILSKEGNQTLPIAETTSYPTSIYKETEKSAEYHIVKSPIVGVFYASPSPEEECFVQKGSRIKKGDTLCIIEAMKLMNEIDADVEGEIVEVLVCNEAVIEYGQPLFKVNVLG